jgi:hypothetical protein
LSSSIHRLGVFTVFQLFLLDKVGFFVISLAVFVFALMQISEGLDCTSVGLFSLDHISGIHNQLYELPLDIPHGDLRYK